MSNMREMTAQMKAIAGVVRDHIAKAFATLSGRIDDLEKRINRIQQDSSGLEACINSAVERAFSEMPKPKDGTSVTVNDVRPIIDDAVKALPPPKDGESVTVDDVRPAIAEEVAKAVSEIPAPKDGKDGRDGKSVPIEQVQRMVDEAVAKAISEFPSPKDGDPGRDAVDIDILPAIDELKSYVRGTYATHNGGLWRAHSTTEGMRGWECIVDGIKDVSIDQINERSFSVRVTRASGSEGARQFEMPTMLYRGVFSQGEQYLPGDTVTWGGSLWHCDEPTSDKPGEPSSKGWRLAVKRGRDGKGVKGDPGSPGKDGKPGRDGRDLTQLGTDGAKW